MATHRDLFDPTDPADIQAEQRQQEVATILAAGVIRMRQKRAAARGRGGGVGRQLESLSDAEVAMASIHPRTKTRMRVCDLCTFVAEHDDYHLARITHLKRDFISRSERDSTSP